MDENVCVLEGVGGTAYSDRMPMMDWFDSAGFCLETAIRADSLRVVLSADVFCIGPQMREICTDAYAGTSEGLWYHCPSGISFFQLL